MAIQSMAVISDAFTITLNSNLSTHAPNGGSNWIAQAGAIVGDADGLSVRPSAVPARYASSFGAANAWVSAEFVTKGVEVTGQGAGVLARLSDDGQNWISFGPIAAGQSAEGYSLVQCVNGVVTPVYAIGEQFPPPGSPFTCTLEVIGNVARCYVDSPSTLGPDLRFEAEVSVTASGKIGIRGFNVASTATDGLRWNALTAGRMIASGLSDGFPASNTSITDVGYRTETGHVWRQVSGPGTMRVENGRAFAAGGAAAVVGSHWPAANCKVSARIRQVGTVTNDNVGLIARYQNDGQHYRAAIDRSTGTPTARLQRIDAAGVFHTIATKTTGLPAWPVSGDVDLMLEVTGTAAPVTLRLYANGAELLEGTNNAYAILAPGAGGIYAATAATTTTGRHVDSVDVDSLDTAAVPVGMSFPPGRVQEKTGVAKIPLDEAFAGPVASYSLVGPVPAGVSIYSVTGELSVPTDTLGRGTRTVKVRATSPGGYADKDVEFRIGTQYGLAIPDQELPTTTAARDALASWMIQRNLDELRTDLRWAHIETVQGTTYNWNFRGLRDTMQRLALDGIGVNLLLSVPVPTWARPSGSATNRWPATPNQRQAAADFAVAAISYYKSQNIIVRRFEILNEPNKPDNASSDTTPQDVALLHIAIYAAIKAAHDDVTVVSSGMAATTNETTGDRLAVPYVQDMLAVAGFKDSWDEFGWHPYNYDWPLNEPGAWTGFGMMRNDIRTLLISAGVGSKPACFSEFGAPTGPVPGENQVCTVDQQASYVFDMHDHSAGNYQWIGKTFWYSMTDRSSMTPPIPNRELYFGLRYSNGVNKPIVAQLDKIKRGA